MLSTDRLGRFAQNKARGPFLFCRESAAWLQSGPLCRPRLTVGQPSQRRCAGPLWGLEFDRPWHGPRRADNRYFEQPVASPAGFFVALSSSVPNAVTANNGKGTRHDTAH